MRPPDSCPRTGSRPSCRPRCCPPWPARWWAAAQSARRAGRSPPQSPPYRPARRRPAPPPRPCGSCAHAPARPACYATSPAPCAPRRAARQSERCETRFAAGRSPPPRHRERPRYRPSKGRRCRARPAFAAGIPPPVATVRARSARHRACQPPHAPASWLVILSVHDLLALAALLEQRMQTVSVPAL